MRKELIVLAASMAALGIAPGMSFGIGGSVQSKPHWKHTQSKEDRESRMRKAQEKRERKAKRKEQR